MLQINRKKSCGISHIQFFWAFIFTITFSIKSFSYSYFSSTHEWQGESGTGNGGCKRTTHCRCRWLPWCSLFTLKKESNGIKKRGYLPPLWLFFLILQRSQFSFLGILNGVNTLIRPPLGTSLDTPPFLKREWESPTKTEHQDARSSFNIRKLMMRYGNIIELDRRTVVENPVLFSTIH